jgi:hypothetical protein
MCTLILCRCILYVVSRLNYMARSGGGVSTRELFLGRKPDA